MGKQAPLTEAMNATELKVTSYYHPNPRVVRVKVERVPRTREWFASLDMTELMRQQAAHYQADMAPRQSIDPREHHKHIHVPFVPPSKVATVRGLAPEVW